MWPKNRPRPIGLPGPVNHDVKLVVVEIAIGNSGVALLRRRLEGAEMRTVSLCSLEKGYMGEVWTRFNDNF